jgi:hypothetical protein
LDKEEGACAQATALIIIKELIVIKETSAPRNKKPETTRKTREDILKFFYAVPSVKSNEPV